jgi:hypothetical protein
MCTEQLPLGGYPIAVKYIMSYMINIHVPLFGIFKEVSTSIHGKKNLKISS